MLRFDRLCCGCVIVLLAVSAQAQEFKSGIEWSEPAVVTPGATDDQPPSDAIVLFDGTGLSAWNGAWTVQDGVMVAAQGNLTTKQAFGDIQLHIEWSAPTEVRGTGQGRGNSGVFLMDRYEVQVLDSFENATYFDGQAGSVYKQTPPLVNAMRKPGEWNTYDLFWTAPTFNVSGEVETPACVTLMHNGILVLNHFELLGPTNYLGPAHYTVHDAAGVIRLQDHGNPVRFRNIWVRELSSPVGQRVSAPYVIINGKHVNPEEAAQAKAADQMKVAVDKAVQAALKKQQKEQQDIEKRRKDAAARKAKESEDKTEGKKAAEPETAGEKPAADAKPAESKPEGKSEPNVEPKPE